MKAKWITLCFSILIGPYSAFAGTYTVAKAEITGAEVFAKIVASTGPMGAVEAKLVDLGGDCVFSVSRNRSNQIVSIAIEGEAKSALKATFAANDLVIYERTALSEEAYKEGYYEDVFSSKNGKVVITISMSKSAVTLASIKTPFTALSCGYF